MSLRSTLRELQEFDAAVLANTLQYIDSTPAEQVYMGGSIGIVTDGGIRDVAGYASVPFYAFAQGAVSMGSLKQSLRGELARMPEGPPALVRWTDRWHGFAVVLNNVAIRAVLPNA